jgi:hypothetical protein
MSLDIARQFVWSSHKGDHKGLKKRTETKSAQSLSEWLFASAQK